MEKEPGITIEMVRNGYSNMQVSQKDVDEILKKYPDLDGIMTTSAVTALGLAEATEGREISIVSVDAQEDALKAVQDGRIVALGAQSGYQIGYETIRYIVNDLEGKRTGEDEILDSQVLTTENIDAYIKEDKYSSS
jgi:ribose transport system substrate-binding protein